MDYKATVLDGFAGWADREPQRRAIVQRDDEWTYETLDRCSDGIALALLDCGVQRGDIVALSAGRTFSMLASLLGIMKAGGAFLPLDPLFPQDRVQFLLQDSGCGVLLADKALERPTPDVKLLIAGTCYGDVDAAGDKRRIKESAVRKDDLAYLLYTSGSTGLPKGVKIGHGSLASFVQGITEAVPFRHWRTMLALTTISFDIFILETLVPLCLGMTVALADEREQSNPLLLKEAMQRYKPDAVQMTPSRMQLLQMMDPELSGLAGISGILVGGESFPNALLGQLQRHTNALIYNLYGPTEATIWAMASDLTHKREVDLGAPLSHLEVCLLDAEGQMMSCEGQGEICLSGPGVGQGYLKRPEQEEAAFIPSPFHADGRMYRTGDWAERLADGRLRFIGRRDEQVKIRGHRVELGEVADSLLRHPDISQAVVLAYSGKNEQLFLCGYYVSCRELALGELKEAVRSFLPGYMVPDCYIRLDRMPETPNQKIDRKALPHPWSLEIGG